MADYFTPPEPSLRHVKPALCGDRDGRDRCNLYRGHEGDHKVIGTSRSWPQSTDLDIT